MIIKNLTDEQVVKMAKLAIMASSPMGMGILHYDAGLKSEDIQLEIRSDYNPGLFVDYYQGRMVKFRAWKKPKGWEFPDTISYEYESWIRKYPNYETLAEAAKSE